MALSYVRDMTSFMSPESASERVYGPGALRPLGKYTSAQAYRVSQGI